MGVHGLWTIVQPCARPVKLETLNRKRLAVDASIWIYQFLKAVRDKDGNALRNSHVVGFFRRICKLLYFGIKPVFVFDGGAPILKRQTIANRKKRREGRREDAVRTASKLLAVQIQRTAEQEAAKRKKRAARVEEDEVPDNPVYADEIFMTEKEKKQSRAFKKKDAYHLPDLHASLEEMGAPNDPRIMSREELEEYARQFHQGEDINLYDFSKIDFDSPFFLSLPATDRYNILNAARLRSRLRMGYSKEQLDNMFPDRMAFSKFQIERVKERNDLTQRLMNINGMNGEEAFYNSGQRIAGERGKEYVLVQDSAVEGGWVLGVVGNKEEGHQEKPIDVDKYFHHEIEPENEEFSDDEEEFEDVPIEGINRLPKLQIFQSGVLDEYILPQTRTEIEHDSDSLFVQGPEVNSQRQSHLGIDDVFEDAANSEDEDLQRAIEMSLQNGDSADEHDHDMLEIPVNRKISPALILKETTSKFVESVEDDDDLDFAAALAQSKRTKNEPSKVVSHPFTGPLPFETLDFSRSSKIEQPTRQDEIDEDAGGFEKEPSKLSKEKLPLPPWFSGPNQTAQFVADKDDDDSLERYRDRAMTPDHLFLKEHRSPDVIDIDQFPENKVIDLDPDSTDEADIATAGFTKTTATTELERQNTRLKSPKVPSVDGKDSKSPAQSDHEAYEWEASDDEKLGVVAKGPVPAPERTPTPEFEDVVIGPEGPDTAAPFILDDQPEITQPIEYVDEDEFSDPEDEELLRQLAAEGEEHVRFAATLNSTAQVESSFDYEQELKQLRSQQKKDRRDADEVTQIMITECQQLLTLFGLPYVTAPMEAEAQCAELVTLGLVDGIITDDSDIFLFGGTRVYKNMFNQSKYVECYLTSDLEKEYALHRRKLISFAHLLGSDYTEGIPGVGPVTALEILTEFSGLDEFRDWWTKVQTGVNVSGDSHAGFYKKFRKQATKIFLPPTFPDPRVDEAYLKPEADLDPSAFQWGVPDLHGLRHFLMATIGWSKNGAGAFAPRVRSGGPSRMEQAFNRLRQEAGAENGHNPCISPENSLEGPSSSTKGKGSKRQAPDPGTADQGHGGVRGGDDTTTKKRRTRKNRKM
ncbi:hypothetical protein AOCH_004993 [Aspergillus ochraceoroseus]|uniref:DNA excision repair protein n=1 Tax=Aspergillus ochraceoroseus TaxID=138278 RepID=A0A0F8UZE3_9EURO|nr:hypothetical protein AOCH_004993 [Aspergillus ochraceoroseus]